MASLQAVFGAAVGAGLAFVVVRMFSTHQEVVKERPLKPSNLMHPKEFVKNANVENVDRVEKVEGRFGMPAWNVIYKDGRSVKLYRPPIFDGNASLPQNSGSLKVSQSKNESFRGKS